MRGRSFGTSHPRGRIALAFVVLALLLRVMVPAGWMPNASARGYAITLCTGMGAVSAWVDGDGRIHKSRPGENRPDHPCVFSGFGAAVHLPSLSAIAIASPLAQAMPVPIAQTAVAIGRGLAAPPPPPTGPPATF